MDKSLHSQISNFALRYQMNKSAAISMAIREFLKNEGKKDSNIEGTYIIKKVTDFKKDQN